uniref:F-box/LRR-repeat protein 15-like leucin rich repeat domain-containing protein n=1 Tax=Manihot esculenta TaxID=3983 RepID=A0A2C9UGE6_MANES
MDNMLCDELLQEIFSKLASKSSPLPPSSTALSVSLVSKRWLRLYRTSKTSLSLRLTPENSTIQSLPSLLSHYPFLSSLSLLFSSEPTSTTPTSITTAFNDNLLFIVSNFCSKLKHLRFLAGPVSISSLFSLSNTCALLTSLTIFLSRPLFLNWVANFSNLKELSVYVSDSDGIGNEFYLNRESDLYVNQEIDGELGLESLYLSGIKRDDSGFGWLWRSCKKLKKLQLKSCEGIGDGGSFFSFIRCLKDLQELELRTCRSIANGVLLRLAVYCDSLNSLLVYDGGSREANFRCLSTLRLQSCCLVTGEGLKALGIARSSELNELALINCDVVGRESGLLATLGQHLKQLRKLDLSHNESLLDKEFISMLVSCNNLIELRLRGCKRLTSLSILSMFKSCKRLQNVDIVHCCGIEAEAVESFVLNSPQLRQIQVEENKISDVARKWASHKFIEIAS